jgi:dihydrofolate reductase
MGSTTYRWVLDNLVRPGSDDAEPWPYDQPTWVFTSREQPVPDFADVRFADGDVEPVHRRMVEAAGGKNLWIVGGGELAGKFHDRGLLDEIVVQVAPVTLGGGAPLFPRAIASPPLRLTSVEKLGAGFAQLRYEVPR